MADSWIYLLGVYDLGFDLKHKQNLSPNSWVCLILTQTSLALLNGLLNHQTSCAEVWVCKPTSLKGMSEHKECDVYLF